MENIREILDPYLDWECRVNLNAVLPKSSRVYRRFSKEECDYHEIYIWNKIFKKKLNLFDKSDTPQTQAQACYDLFKCFQNPRALVLPTRYIRFKMVTIEKLLYFTDNKDLKKKTVTPDLANKLSNLCKMLIPIMLSLKYRPIKHNITHPIKII